MGRHETGANDGFSITNGWVDSGYGEDPLVKETLGEGKCLGFATNEDGHYRALRGSDFKPDRLEPFMHLASIAPEHLDALWFRLHDFKGFKDSTDNGGSQRSSEDEAAGLVLHKFYHLMRTGDEPPHGTEGLGKGSHDDLDIVIDPEMMSHTASLRTDHTERVGFVHIHDCPVFLGSLYHRRQISHIAGHTEDTIHDDKASGLLRDTLQSIAKGVHRVVTIGNQLSGSDLATLNDGGMVLTVTENKIIGLGQSGKSTLIGKETSGKKKGAFATKESSQRLLKFIVKRDRSIKQSGTGASSTKLASRLAGRLNDTGILSQAKVVVRPYHDLLFATADNMVPVALLNAAEIRVESLSSGICRIAILSALLEEVSGHCLLVGKSQESESV